MAIRMMTRNFDSNLPPWGRCEGPAHPDSFSVTFEGRVLETREMNGRDDSDFYALVWNDETGTIERVDYATTRGWTYPNSAVVDATPEVVALATARRAEVAAAARAAREAEEALVPRVGRTVRVVRGRKVPVGTVAEVRWFGKDRYARVPRGRVFEMYVPSEHRVGLWIDGEMAFTSANNVEVLTNEEVNA